MIYSLLSELPYIGAQFPKYNVGTVSLCKATDEFVRCSLCIG